MSRNLLGTNRSPRVSKKIRFCRASPAPPTTWVFRAFGAHSWAEQFAPVPNCLAQNLALWPFSSVLISPLPLCWVKKIREIWGIGGDLFFIFEVIMALFPKLFPVVQILPLTLPKFGMFWEAHHGGHAYLSFAILFGKKAQWGVFCRVGPQSTGIPQGWCFWLYLPRMRCVRGWYDRVV